MSYWQYLTQIANKQVLERKLRLLMYLGNREIMKRVEMKDLKIGESMDTRRFFIHKGSVVGISILVALQAASMLVMGAWGFWDKQK